MRLAEALGELGLFLDHLGEEVGAGEVCSPAAFVERCRAFYTPERMAAIEAVVPGWIRMASYEDGQTLWHVTAAMVTLPTLPEYQALPESARATMEWVVLLHDLAKEPAGGRDHRHAIRSAAVAGRLLPRLGFPVSEAYASEIDAWFHLTDGAFRFDEKAGDEVTDNAKLPAILEGGRRIFGDPTYAAVAAIALHTSITVLAAWPAKAPLTDEEVARYVDAETRPLLLALMQADHGGWNLFDRELLESMYAETRAVFRALRSGE